MKITKSRRVAYFRFAFLSKPSKNSQLAQLMNGRFKGLHPSNPSEFPYPDIAHPEYRSTKETKGTVNQLPKEWNTPDFTCNKRQGKNSNTRY